MGVVDATYKYFSDCMLPQFLSEFLGISLRTTKSDLYALRDMNLIQYVGSNKTGHWEIINKG